MDTDLMCCHGHRVTLMCCHGHRFDVLPWTQSDFDVPASMLQMGAGAMTPSSIPEQPAPLFLC